MATTLRVLLQGFEGKLYMDGLTLQEVESHIDDAYLHIPLATEFEGMRIARITRNPLARDQVLYAGPILHILHNPLTPRLQLYATLFGENRIHQSPMEVS